MSENQKPVCGYCGHAIQDGAVAFDPRGLAADGSQRLLHRECEPKFRVMLAQDAEAKAKRDLWALKAASKQVWEKYLAYGPVDDGRPESFAFSEALDELMKAAVEAGVEFKRRKRAKK